MAEKKSPAEGWPVINGDYVVGDPESPVAAATLASHIEQIPVDAGAAIAGPCKTENLGIEKMLANLISNPNIRFLVLCGSEVQGHITGQSIEALHANGVDPEKRKIVKADGAIPFIENIPDEGIEKMLANLISNPNIRFLVLCGSEVQGHITGQSIEALHANGVDPEKRKIVKATGAIPFIENIPDEGIERFQQQMEIVSIIDTEDAAAIQSKIKECIEKDPGAFEEEAMVIKVEEGGEEEEEGEAIPPVAPETALIEARMRNIQTQVKAVGGLQRIFAGMYSGKVQGLVVGLAFTLIIGTILLLK